MERDEFGLVSDTYIRDGQTMTRIPGDFLRVYINALSLRALRDLARGPSKAEPEMRT